jgi:hypothetical protein
VNRGDRCPYSIRDRDCRRRRDLPRYRLALSRGSKQERSNRTSGPPAPGLTGPADKNSTRVHRGGFEILYRRASERQTRPACPRRALCRDQQDAHLSSPKVVESADQIARKIVDTYLAPNKIFPELREMVNSGSLDLLRDFSDACRAEFESFQAAAP